VCVCVGGGGGQPHQLTEPRLKESHPPMPHHQSKWFIAREHLESDFLLCVLLKLIYFYAPIIKPLKTPRGRAALGEMLSCKVCSVITGFAVTPGATNDALIINNWSYVSCVVLGTQLFTRTMCWLDGRVHVTILPVDWRRGVCVCVCVCVWEGRLEPRDLSLCHLNLHPQTYVTMNEMRRFY